jgi:hypothetical protein
MIGGFWAVEWCGGMPAFIVIWLGLAVTAVGTFKHFVVSGHWKRR